MDMGPRGGPDLLDYGAPWYTDSQYAVSFHVVDAPGGMGPLRGSADHGA